MDDDDNMVVVVVDDWDGQICHCVANQIICQSPENAMT